MAKKLYAQRIPEVTIVRFKAVCELVGIKESEYLNYALGYVTAPEMLAQFIKFKHEDTIQKINKKVVESIKPADNKAKEQTRNKKEDPQPPPTLYSK